MEKRRNCSWGAIFPLFHNIFNIYFYLKESNYIVICKNWLFKSFFPQDYKSDMSKYGYLELFFEGVVYLWGFYDIKFKLTQYESKLGLIPQYTFDLREFDITNLKFGSNTTIYLAQHVTLTNYKPKPGLIPQHI